ncbi:MAG: ABC-2 transporter permease [Gudongella sp.]|nr:ABC-2 transporter permease [Gudongella sp.]
MFELLKKDMIISRKPMMLIGVLVILWGIPAYLIQNEVMGQAIFGYYLFFQAYYLLIMLTQKDESVKADIVINSLPVERSLVVAVRYIYFIIQPVLFSVVLIALTGIIWAVPSPGFPDGRIFSPIGALVVLPMIWIMFSIYLPINYLSIGKTRVFNQLSLMALIILPSIISRYFRIDKMPGWINDIGSFPLELIIPGFILVSLLAYFISYKISKRIYREKDFH